MEWKRGGRKSCERNYSKAEECLIYSWTVKVECKAKCVCVCDKTGTSLSFAGKYRSRGWSSCAIIVFRFVFHAEEPQTTISPSFLQLPHCLHPLITSICWETVTLICILLKKKKKMNLLEGTGGELVVSVCGLPWVDSQPVFNSAIGRQWANVQTHARFAYEGTASSFDMSISCQVVPRLVSIPEVWFHGLLAELLNRQAAAFSALVCSVISLGRQYKSQRMFLIAYLMQW